MGQKVRRGQLAKILGTTTPTIKHYTSIGLLQISGKTQHGQHLYDPEIMTPRFQKIQELKARRFTLEEIKDRLTIECLMKESA